MDSQNIIITVYISLYITTYLDTKQFKHTLVRLQHIYSGDIGQLICMFKLVISFIE
jgi:hypothetical protein